MARDISDLDVEKNRVVHDLFIDTADDNYVVSRWAYTAGLNIDYAWLAVHAIEKYLKAALLLNGQSAHRYGHDITKLYPAVEDIAGELLPKMLDKPSQIDLLHWHDETPEKYLARLHGYGNAHNRYLIFGYVLHMEDLFKFDRMVWAIRRLCGQLDTYILGKHQRQEIEERENAGGSIPTWREILSRQPDYWDWIGSNLSNVIAGRRGDEIRNVVLNHNLYFAPRAFDHQRMPIRSASHEPVLYRSIVEPLTTKGFSAQARSLALETCLWLEKNVYLPQEVLNELRKAVSQFPNEV